MLNKLITVLFASVVFGSASVAIAEEVPEHKIGDRYPFLEQTYRPAANATRTAQRQPTNAGLYANQDPENRISDRYPWLEAQVKPIDVRTGNRNAARSTTFAERKLFDRQTMVAVY